MSRASRTGFVAPNAATRSIARPICSVVHTDGGKAFCSTRRNRRVQRMDEPVHIKIDLGLAREVNPHTEVIQISATRGAGLNAWYTLLKRRHSNSACEERR
jgi:hypothetical protein